MLVGAGHAHLGVIRDAARWPPGRLRVTVVAPADFWYSGLATGMLGGQYAVDDDEVDVPSVCRRAGVAYREGKLAGLDPAAKRVTLDGGESLDYDVLSLNLGSESAPLDGLDSAPPGSVFTSKPISNLGRLRRHLESRSGCPRVAVVGGGYTGSECALNLAALPGGRRVTLFCSGDRPAEDLPRRASAAVLQTLCNAGVDVRLDSRIARVEGSELLTEGGGRHAFDVLLISVGFRPPPICRELGLETDDRCHLLVDRRLRCLGHANVFAAGDSAELAGGGKLPKVGVVAVRQGHVLAKNLPAAALGGRLRKYRPLPAQPLILNLANGTGLLTAGPLWWRGRSMMRLKRKLDYRWLNTLRPGR